MRSPHAASVLLTLLATAVPAAALPTASPATASPAVAAPRPAGSASNIPGPAPTTTAAERRRTPDLRVTTRVADLDHPWDVQRLPGVGLLVSERDRARLTLVAGSERRVLGFPSAEVWVSGETGLMGLAVDPGFTDNRRFYTCQGGFRSGGGHDVRVVAWRLNQAATRAARTDVLLSGIQATSGRHGGCRLLIADGGALLVGTGDAAVGTNARNRSSLNGKVLRLNRFSGAASKANPWAGSRNANRRYVYTYGHRNVQGLAQRGDGSLWSVEHGSYRDDEVNLLRKGGDYGWNPVPGYNEKVPMTDLSLPGRQVRAAWRSGNPTVATSGATFVRGSRWGSYAGTLAVGVLKDEKLLFQRFDRRGRLTNVRSPKALTTQGRLRSVTQLPGGALLVTTDGRPGGDRVLKVTPR